MIVTKQDRQSLFQFLVLGLICFLIRRYLKPLSFQIGDSVNVGLDCIVFARGKLVLNFYIHMYKII